MRTTGFRDDIQGVRALAVLAVVVYHAGLGPFTGGFVGLDVFFVVSGYLITTLLMREHQRTGRISLVGFYARRARRILPAATFAALVTVAASWYLLNLVDARDAAFDALWASLFLANVRFATEQTDYFTQDVAPSPLQHFWSLSVEEQFYLVLPLVLVLCAAWAGWAARGSRRAPRAGADPSGRFALTVGVLTVASLAWSVHATAASPDSAYFSTFTRVWEFGAGTLLALATPHFAALLTARARNLLGVLGLGAVALAALTFTGRTAFPGYAALLPVLGTCALMLAGAELRGRTPAVQRLLGSAPMRVVGDASYSIYLWHWPVLVVLTQRAEEPLSTAGTLGALMVVAAISWVSYRWIETPFRRARPNPPGRALVLYPVSVAVVLAGCGASTTWVARDRGADAPAIATSQYTEAPDGADLAPDPALALVQASAQAALQNAPVPGDLSPDLLDLREDKADLGDCEYAGPPFALCERGDTDADRSLVVLGDSHGRHWIPALDRIARRAGYRAHYLVKPACTPVPVRVVEQGTEQEWEDCSAFNAWTGEQLDALDPDLVLVSTSTPASVVVDGSAEDDGGTVLAQMRQGWAELLADLAGRRARTVVLGDTPRFSFDPVECLGRRDVDLGDCAGAPVQRQRQGMEDSRAAAAAAGVEFVDTTPWFCASDLCPAVIGSTVVLRDSNHLTTEYATTLTRPLGRALGLLATPGGPTPGAPTPDPAAADGS